MQFNTGGTTVKWVVYRWDSSKRRRFRRGSYADLEVAKDIARSGASRLADPMDELLVVKEETTQTVVAKF